MLPTSWASRLGNVLRDTDRFLFFRLTLGLLLLYKGLSLGPYWLAFFSEQGFFSREVIELNNSPGRLSWYLWCDTLAAWSGSTAPQISLIFRAIFITACLSLMAGLLTRLSVALLLLINVSLTSTFLEYSYGVDFFLSSLLFYALFFPLGGKHSLDTLISRKWPAARHLIFRGIPPVRALHFLRLHLCVVYLIGGLTKMGGPTWWNGEAVWKAIHRPGNELGLLIAQEIPVREIYIVLGVATIFVELLYPALIWWRRTRNVWLWLTLGMHLFIGLVLELHLFASVMIFFNLLAFGRFNPTKSDSSMV